MGNASHAFKASVALVTVWALLFSFAGVPLWMATIALALIILTMIWSAISQWRARELERSRARRGVCIRCAYDLRGVTDRCPECGIRVPSAKR